MPKRIRKRDLIIEFLQLTIGIGQKKGKKAAPRFELGIKDLQSSALPLGHAAMGGENLSSADRISHNAQCLLVLSNGHGEDVIALRILEHLHVLRPELLLEVLPMVGEGKAYASAVEEGWIRRIGPLMNLPSGGFSNQSISGMFADIGAGLLKNTVQQWLLVKDAVHKGRYILAVGDLLPLFFAWTSGAPFGFIGTPKSDYTWRSGPGHALSDLYHRLKGTEWDPWEYILMKTSRCKLVAVRDRLTARGLRRHGVIANALGNPMMDGLKKEALPFALSFCRRLLVLCGSRMPEAGVNFQRLIDAIELVDIQTPVAILVALSSQPNIDEVEIILTNLGYQLSNHQNQEIGAITCWEKGSRFVFLGPGQFSCWASWAEVGIANAGTATEQLVGLGIPALSLPGVGPQFKRSFAVRQSRLLGGAVMPCSSPEGLASKLKLLLGDAYERQKRATVGVQRMGGAGASTSLAKLLLKLLFVQEKNL